jgi:SAM-dependent methyltransferase
VVDEMLKLALRILPNSLLFALFHLFERRRFRQFLRRRLGPNFIDVDPGPVAPPPLIKKTAALNEDEFRRECNPDVYFTGGYHVAANWCAILEHFHVNLRTLGAIYEIGCGSCRLLRHFRCFGGVRIVGSDVNSEMVEWCRGHIPGIEFHQNELQPPLRFADDNSFDLILALSVFTHIPIEWQRDWLSELHRILRPGGILLCTVSGANHERLQLDAEQRVLLKKTGQLVLQQGDRNVSLSTAAGGSKCDVFQIRSDVIRVFGESFTLLDYVPGGQDLLVLQKPAGGKSLTARPYPRVSFSKLD